jgi:hypothetical protein
MMENAILTDERPQLLLALAVELAIVAISGELPPWIDAHLLRLIAATESLQF